MKAMLNVYQFTTPGPDPFEPDSYGEWEHVLAESSEQAIEIMFPGGGKGSFRLEEDGGDWRVWPAMNLDKFVPEGAVAGTITFTDDELREAGWRFEGDRSCDSCGEISTSKTSVGDAVCANCRLCPECLREELQFDPTRCDGCTNEGSCERSNGLEIGWSKFKADSNTS